MRTLFLLAMLIFATLAAPARASADGECGALLDHRVRPLGEGEPVDLCALYRDKVVVVVNTASRCAFTPQYEGLEALYRRYRERGLVVLGFPSNDFGNQEPGTEAQIKSFCELTYDVGFPMFEKTRAAKGAADPIYIALADAAGTYPTWNFFKYVLDREGKLAGHFSSRVRPDDPRLVDLIESLL